MSVKYFLLNILLCFLILFIAIANYKTWNHSADILPKSGALSKKSGITNENPPMMVCAKELTSIQSADLISQQNIFSPERKDFPIPSNVVVAEAKKTPVRPQIVLYGLTIAGDYQAATVLNPERQRRKDEREIITIKMGDNIGEYKLAKILPDRIAMECNGDTFEVLLYDSNYPKKKIEVKTETKPAMIASTQPPIAPPHGEPPEATPSEKPAEKPKELVQAGEHVPPSLPFNKYTYQLLGPTAAISRGKIFDPASGTSAQ
jgi:hypothetical protein